jgi:hypothetical protein
MSHKGRKLSASRRIVAPIEAEGVGGRPGHRQGRQYGRRTWYGHDGEARGERVADEWKARCWLVGHARIRGEGEVTLLQPPAGKRVHHGRKAGALVQARPPRTGQVAHQSRNLGNPHSWRAIYRKCRVQPKLALPHIWCKLMLWHHRLERRPCVGPTSWALRAPFTRSAEEPKFVPYALRRAKPKKCATDSGPG